ncbi:MAG: hypothetical protein OM95_02450 [Bdellovibrio sp. ArHS]|uniref:DUF6178 family protein n=1 Tax=Bdellovibrio sp. ArHS TaxID=1569284 RepID=UPI000582B56E|nr:DUF6178 family protein [Bdellovibrio sp. ArHS]KHD89607.1 MAG: hypothetical protein OM95_02450 [Bdellovibrio sp. ArHS]
MTKSLTLKADSQSLLTQLIANADLVRDIQNLDSGVVKKIIQQIGLEDAGEFLMLVSSEQLHDAMEQDIWLSPKQGADEQLNSERFLTWLEILLEIGASFAVEKIAEMDEDLLCAVLAEKILAIENDELALMAQEADEDEHSKNRYLEKALESVHNMDLGEYVIMAKSAQHWDTISHLLIAMQKEHQDILDRLLSRLQRISLEEIDDSDGLYELLSEGEVITGDVTAKRSERREEQGFVTASTSTAFLKMIEQSTLAELQSEKEQDHITKMYFRNLKPGKPQGVKTISPNLLQILKMHSLHAETSSTPLQLSSAKERSAIRNYLTELRTSNQELFQKKLGELNYLANILMTGYQHRKEPLRPIEAMDLAISVCDRGFQVAQSMQDDINEGELVKLFKIGWKKFKK